MMTHPQAVGGPQRFSTRLMEALPGRIVAKGGAEGLECLGLTERGWGVAVKCEDGANRGAGPATIALLEQIGIARPAERNALERLRSPGLRNHAGLQVGHLEARLELATPTR
jgi:L-asparaginase II